MHVARDLSEGHIRSAFRLEMAWAAVAGACAIEDGPAVVDPAGACQQLALGTDVDIAFFVEGEVGSGERAVLAGTHVPDGDMRRDALSNQPAEELTGAICRISSETVRFKSQSFLGSHDHCLCRRDFVIGAGGSGFHIDDYGVLNVDQIIEPVAKLNALVGLR